MEASWPLFLQEIRTHTLLQTLGSVCTNKLGITSYYGWLHSFGGGCDLVRFRAT
jgi:hypothetical protein